MPTLSKIITACALLASAPALAQWLPFPGYPARNGSVTIATELTYQNVPLPNHVTVTIENNNKTDYCWIEITGLVVAGDTTATSVNTLNQIGVPAAKASIMLSPGGGSYGRYTFVPQGNVVATCEGAGDGLYVDTQ